jgi:aryl-alcohol dehydrogenase-like predicted oxidoreductase
MTKIALGTWAWGAGAFGGDKVFGSKTDVENLKPVFDAAMKAGLSLWDTATAYGMGESEKILGQLAKNYKREDILISTKFTPQIAEFYDNSVEKMADASIERVGVSNHNIKEIQRANEILAGADFKVSAVQNHFSLLYRSSEKGGVLDYS